MTLIELKKGLHQRMQEVFPITEYEYHSKAVVEGYSMPCFFTQIIPVEMAPANYNTRHNIATFYITYMQDAIDEMDALKVIEKIRTLFDLGCQIGDRYIKTTEFEFEFTGTEDYIPEISITFEWNDKIEHINNQPLMESAEISLTYKEE